MPAMSDFIDDPCELSIHDEGVMLGLVGWPVPHACCDVIFVQSKTECFWCVYVSLTAPLALFWHYFK